MTRTRLFCFLVFLNSTVIVCILANQSSVNFTSRYNEILTHFDPTSSFYRYYSLGQRKGLNFIQAESKCVIDKGFLARSDSLNGTTLEFVGNWLQSFSDIDQREIDWILSVRRPVWIHAVQGSPSPVC